MPNNDPIAFDTLFNDLSTRLGGEDAQVLSNYWGDPIGFGKNILGHEYPDDIKEVLKSVVENRITIAMSCNGPGKSYTAGDLAQYWFKATNNSKVYVTAAPPEDNLRNNIWGKISTAIHHHPDMYKGDIITDLEVKRIGTKGQEDIDHIKGIRIPTQGTHHDKVSKFSGKHAQFILFIVDEADGVPDAIFEGIETCMTGGMARLLILFNPKAKRGAVYRMIRDKQANVIRLNAFNQPNVVHGRDIFPGAVNRENVAQRINKWCYHLSGDFDENSKEVFELPDFMVGHEADQDDGSKFPPLKAGHYRIDNPIFYYVVLGMYPPHDVNQLIDQAWIQDARDRWDQYVGLYGETPPEGAEGISGLDPAEFGRDETVQCFRYGGFLARFKKWRGIDVIQTGDRASDNCREMGTPRCSVDANGVGAGVPPHMRRIGVKAFAFKTQQSPTTTSEMGEFRILRDELLWAVREWLRTDPYSMLPPSNDLIEELSVLTYSFIKGKIVVMTKDEIKDLLKRSPGELDALGMTFTKMPSIESGMNDILHQQMKAKYCAPTPYTSPHHSHRITPWLN